MDDVRWMTSACASEFVGKNGAVEAFKASRFKPLYKQYFKQNPETWFSPPQKGGGGGRRIRTAGLAKGAPRPGPRVIGQCEVYTPAIRSWVWEDDWSVIGEDLGVPYYWMIAIAKRVKDSTNQDLQEIGKPILHDPDDSWRPTLDDYADWEAHLAEKHREDNIEAIHRARDEAHEHRMSIIPVALHDHAADIAEAYVEDVDHEGVIIEYFSLRYFALSKRYANGAKVPRAELEDLASFAFDDLPEGVEFEEVTETSTYIEDLKIDHSRVICFVADLTE